MALVPEVELAEDEAGALRRVRIGGRDVTDELHAPEVDRRVSIVARQPLVRGALLETQRELAAGGRIILAGRDIGTVVLPDAEVKLYLEVSIEERARRRAAERGLAPVSPEAEAILADLRRRDHIDSSRDVAPLRVPEDAVVVRSDGRPFEDSVAEVVSIIRAREQQREHRPMSRSEGPAPTRLRAWHPSRRRAGALPAPHRRPRPLRAAGHRPGPRGGRPRPAHERARSSSPPTT